MGVDMDKKQREVWVVGHKNPDTDSICSAIAYADLKTQAEKKSAGTMAGISVPVKSSDEQHTDKGVQGRKAADKSAPADMPANIYKPKRAGELNEETKYVLNTFGAQEPELITDVSTQVMDIEIRRTKPIKKGTTLKSAWAKMREENVVTLPVTNSSRDLAGVITTSDIATSYMDVYDSEMLSKTRTRFRDIAETLEGSILCGNENAFLTKGKVMVGSANPEVMEDFIDENDLVITGSRYEAQLCAIEADASAVVITGDSKVSKTIMKIAQERECVLISTPYDTFTAVRLINQSMQVKYFMRSRNLITFGLEEHIDDVRKVMSKERHRDFPVLDDDGKYVGMISRRNLLNMRRKQLILVDHNEKSQAVEGIDAADILEIIDHHRIGSLETLSPVFFRNQPLGCTATIIWLMYREQGIEIRPEIAGLLCSAIISDTLLFRSPTSTPTDQAAAKDLARIAGVDLENHAKAMFRAGSNFSSKTPDEIFHQDFKVFNTEKADFGVAQISAMTRVELEEVKEKLTPYLKEAMAEHQISMVFVMLTNIMEETTYLQCAGEGADELMAETYGVEPVAHISGNGSKDAAAGQSDKTAGDADAQTAEGSAKKQSDAAADEKAEGNQDRIIDGVYVLPGVVSRKKQLIPKFMSALQEG